jgi:hypothetical protein
MESLATLQARLEQQEREWEESSPVHSPHRSPVRSPEKSANGLNIDAEGVEAGEHKHKHKNSPARKNHLKVVPTHAAEEKSLLENENGFLDVKMLGKCHSEIDNLDNISIEDMKDFVENILIPIVST